MKKKKIKIEKLLTLCISFILAIIFLSPFYIILSNAFKTKKELFSNTLSLPQSLMLTNFKEAYKDLNFLSAIANSLIITIASVTVIVIFSSMAAWMLERTKSRISSFILFLFISAMLIPFQAVMLPLVKLMGNLKLLNMYGLVFMYLGFGTSLSVFLFHGFVKSIPKELDEAAIIDGCSKAKTFWLIIFPLLKPITITVAILNTVWIWNDYLLPSLVINKPATQTIPLKTFLFFGEYTKQWNLAMAGLILDVIPVIIFYFLAQKHIIKSITSGSIK